MSQKEEAVQRDLKCAYCCQILENPVQLPVCFHILCLKCKQSLENNFGHGITCPQCGKESAQDLICDQEVLKCDFSHDAAWSCFECGKNMCTTCYISHAKDHKITLLADLHAQNSRIWNKVISDSTSQEAEQTDSPNQNTVQCPLCNRATCPHVELLQSLIAGPQGSDSCCQRHLDSSNKPLELTFFCLECCIPICRDCSMGQHKLHTTDDMSDCGRRFVAESLEISYKKLKMLVKTSDRDANEAKAIEDQLRCHINDTNHELDSRILEIIEVAKHTFDTAITDVASQGCSILTEYKEKQNAVVRFQAFLLKVLYALCGFKIDEQAEIAQYTMRFRLQKSATELIREIEEGYRRLTKPNELRLVLPEVEAIPTPPAHLARVGAENKHLKLAFSFPLRGDYCWTNSIVLTGSEQCLLSVRSSAATDFDCIVHCHYKNDKVNFKEYDVDKGKYLLSRLASGEIVASYSCPRKGASKYDNAVLYFNGILPKGDKLLFGEIAKFDFPPYGIATTKDNNIILCVSADEEILSGEKACYEKKGLTHVVSMSLRGKVLNSSLRQPGANLIKPDYIAVSNGGEICVSDTSNNSIVILDQNLKIRERMNYQLATSMRDMVQIDETSERKRYQFEPHGACYDTYGRIIVADPDNNSVVRLVRASGSHKYTLEPLLNENTFSGFISPKLVAMGEDSRLWVVCPEFVFVFDYCV